MARTQKEDIGKVMLGRIRAYSTQQGYGYILTEEGNDLFVSSRALGKTEKKIAVGSIVKFKVGEYNGKPVATEIEVLKKYKNDVSMLDLPDGVRVAIKSIIKFGKTNAFSVVKKNGITEEDLKEHGYSIKDLDYIYIETGKHSYSIFDTKSPVKGDGRTNIKEFYKNLKNDLLKLDKETIQQCREMMEDKEKELAAN